ncbi:MAG: DNA polymerase III subunit delta [Lachnospiraceae bacterium]|nr:DNA polymerase III subunit delta [Lachnospiraceae bacterium]
MGKDLESDIKEGKFHNFYLICGEEASLRIMFKKKLVDATVGDQLMNYLYFTDDTFDINTFRTAGITCPFFGDYRIIVLENTGFLNEASEIKEEMEQFPDSTIVVFVEENVDKRNKIYKFIQKNGIIKSCDAPDENTQMIYLAGLLKKNNKTMRNNTAKYFLSQIETSFFNIQNEVEKLVAYVGDNEEITVEDIDNVSSKLITNHIFAMMDEIAVGHKDKALSMYLELLLLRESSMRILYQITRHFNILINVRSAEKYISYKEIASVIKIPPFFVKKYVAQAKRFSNKDLRVILEKCLQMEYDFKNGLVSDQIGVEMLIFDIIMITCA